MSEVFSSPDSLYSVLLNAYRQSVETHFVILVGGCSRAGKSTLTTALEDAFRADGVPVLAVNMDGWLVSVEKRKPKDAVSERYELSAVYEAVQQIKTGATVLPPVYDPVSRRRVEDKSGSPLCIPTGVLIVEGVVALADEKIRSLASSSIFVRVSDSRRLRRLVDFYGRVKQLSREEYRAVILARESEEVPFVKSTAKYSFFNFEWA